MKAGIVEAIAACLAAAIMAVPVTASAAMDEIDCGTSSFEFAAEGFQVDCERSTDQVRAEGATGATEVDVMTVTGDDRHVFITVVAISLKAPRLIMERRSLGQNFREAFDDIKAEDWNGVGTKGGYDTAEFNAVISGVPSSCIAIQRYLNPMYSGFKRRLIGLGCSLSGHAEVYDALAKLRAPGD
jgi:hypothetical protein